MNAAERLHALQQSLWLDNITREMLDQGTLKHYVDTLAITGLTSNPTIFDEAISGTSAYDAAIAAGSRAGLSGEALFVELALQDLRRAADIFMPIHRQTAGVDGWVSMEVSPLLADDTAGTVAAALQIHRLAQRANLYVKIPGTAAGINAIEEAIYLGVPVNVTLLFSREHYMAAADAYLRGIERRLDEGLDPRISSVASLFVSRWDRAVADKVPAGLRNRLGIAMAKRTYRAYRDMLGTRRWLRLAAAGAHPQRLLWASTGVKDPAASPNLYVEALAAPATIDTMPEKTLLAFAATGKLSGILAADGGDAEEVLQQFAQAGIDIDRLAAKLQQDGAQAFVNSWNELLERIAAKSTALKK
ncbi:MAG: transaldolase [Steroidobacterales bacterium]